MFAEPRTWVDIEPALRAWARQAVPSVSGRIFLGVSNRAAFPQVVLFRIAGADDQCLIQWDVWGGDLAEVAAVATELATALDAMSRFTHSGVLLHGARVDTVRRQPDEESDRARYIVESTVTATAAQ